MTAIDRPETLTKEWADPLVMIAEGEALVREGWEIAAREPLPGGGARVVFRRRKTRVEDGQ